MTDKEVIAKYQRLHDMLSERIEDSGGSNLMEDALGEYYDEVRDLLESVANYPDYQ